MVNNPDRQNGNGKLLAYPLSNRTVIAVLAITGCCFVMSLGLPCIDTTPAGSEPFIGLVLLLIGPLGIFDGVVAWYANPLLVLMLVFLTLRKYRIAVLCGMSSLTLAISTFAIREILVSERPDYAMVTGYGAGFYLWLTGIVIPLCVSIACLYGSSGQRGKATAVQP